MKILLQIITISEIIGGITINVSGNVTKVIDVKKIIFRMLLHLVVNMENI